MDTKRSGWYPFAAALAAALLISSGCGSGDGDDAAAPTPEQAAVSETAEATGDSEADGRDPEADGATSEEEAADPASSPTPDAATTDAPRRSASTPGRARSTESNSARPAAGSAAGSPAPAPSSDAPSNPQKAPAPGSGPTPAPGSPKPPTPAPEDIPQGTEEIVIGNIGTYTGPAGGSLKRFPEGVQVWVKWINERGGINGHPVKLIIVDDGGDPARHKAAKQDLVERKDVVAFVGNGEPIAGESSVDYSTKKGIPMIGNEGGSDWYYDSPMYFPYSPNGDTYWHSMMPALAEVAKGKKKFGSVACVEAETACGGADRVWHEEGAAEKNGFEPVYRGRVSLAQPDYTAECLAAQRAGVEVLVLVIDDTSIGRFGNSCGRQRYHPLYAWPLAPAATRHKDDPNLDGAAVLLNFFPWTKDDTPATAEFQSAMKKHFSGTVEPGHAGGWASGKMLEKAARATAAPHTSVGILDGLYSFSGETLGGLTMPMTFERGKPTPRVECWGQLVIDSGKYIAMNDGAIRCR